MGAPGPARIVKRPLWCPRRYLRDFIESPLASRGLLRHRLLRARFLAVDFFAALLLAVGFLAVDFFAARFLAMGFFVADASTRAFLAASKLDLALCPAAAIDSPGVPAPRRPCAPHAAQFASPAPSLPPSWPPPSARFASACAPRGEARAQCHAPPLRAPPGLARDALDSGFGDAAGRRPCACLPSRGLASGCHDECSPGWMKVRLYSRVPSPDNWR